MASVLDPFPRVFFSFVCSFPVPSVLFDLCLCLCLSDTNIKKWGHQSTCGCPPLGPFIILSILHPIHTSTPQCTLIITSSKLGRSIGVPSNKSKNDQLSLFYFLGTRICFIFNFFFSPTLLIHSSTHSLTHPFFHGCNGSNECLAWPTPIETRGPLLNTHRIQTNPSSLCILSCIDTSSSLRLFFHYLFPSFPSFPSPLFLSFFFNPSFLYLTKNIKKNRTPPSSSHHDIMVRVLGFFFFVIPLFRSSLSLLLLNRNKKPPTYKRVDGNNNKNKKKKK